MVAFDASISLHATFNLIDKSTNWTDSTSCYIRDSRNFRLSTGSRAVIKVLEMLFSNAIMLISVQKLERGLIVFGGNPLNNR